MREISDLEARVQNAASITKAAGASLIALGNVMSELAPLAKASAERFAELSAAYERSLRERLGPWRYLSSEWWSVRGYRKESGDAS